MEKNIKSYDIDIVIKARKDAVVFEIKDPNQLNKALLNDIKQDYFLIQNDSIVIYPEQKIVDTNGIFLENSARYI